MENLALKDLKEMVTKKKLYKYYNRMRKKNKSFISVPNVNRILKFHDIVTVHNKLMAIQLLYAKLKIL